MTYDLTGRDRPLIQAGSGLVALVILVMAGMLYSAISSNRQATMDILRSERISEALATLGRELHRAETAQQGHILSGDSSYLSSRQSAAAALPGAIDRLRRYADHDPHRLPARYA